MKSNISPTMYYFKIFHKFTPNCFSIGISEVKNSRLTIIPIAPRIIPRKRQFFAFPRSSFLNAKYAMIPPINPKKIGTRYQQLLLCLSGSKYTLLFFWIILKLFLYLFYLNFHSFKWIFNLISFY